jgi:hypothetical protein
MNIIEITRALKKLRMSGMAEHQLISSRNSWTTSCTGAAIGW